MSAVITNIDDLEFIWRAADDGFLSGVNFKAWLANSMIELRATIAEQARQLDEAREIIKASRFICSEKSILHGMITNWLAAHPVPQEQHP